MKKFWKEGKFVIVGAVLAMISLLLWFSPVDGDPNAKASAILAMFLAGLCWGIHIGSGAQ